MVGRLCLLLYRIVLWRANRLSQERSHALRGKWALRFYAITTGGLDDDFAAEPFELVQERPALLDELERQAAGDSRSARQKQMMLRILREARARGIRTPY